MVRNIVRTVPIIVAADHFRVHVRICSPQVQAIGDTCHTFELDALDVNLADKEYVSNCGSFGCYYGDGRTVMGRVSVSW